MILDGTKIDPCQTAIYLSLLLYNPLNVAKLPAPTNARRSRCVDLSKKQGCQPVFTKKSQTLSPKKNSSFEAYTHKTCIPQHKIDIKTRQK